MSSGCCRSIDGSSNITQAFIDSYLDLLVDDGANITAVDGVGWTPLHVAAEVGAPCVTDYLCRHLPPADIDRGTTGGWYPSEPGTKPPTRFPFARPPSAMPTVSLVGGSS